MEARAGWKPTTLTLASPTGRGAAAGPVCSASKRRHSSNGSGFAARTGGEQGRLKSPPPPDKMSSSSLVASPPPPPDRPTQAGAREAAVGELWKGLRRFQPQQTAGRAAARPRPGRPSGCRARARAPQAAARLRGAAAKRRTPSLLPASARRGCPPRALRAAVTWRPGCRSSWRPPGPPHTRGIAWTFERWSLPSRKGAHVFRRPLARARTHGTPVGGVDVCRRTDSVRRRSCSRRRALQRPLLALQLGTANSAAAAAAASHRCAAAAKGLKHSAFHSMAS